MTAHSAAQKYKVFLDAYVAKHGTFPPGHDQRTSGWHEISREAHNAHQHKLKMKREERRDQIASGG